MIRANNSLKKLRKMIKSIQVKTRLKKLRKMIKAKNRLQKLETREEKND